MRLTASKHELPRKITALVLSGCSTPQGAKAKLQQKTDVEAATAAGARALEGAHAVVRAPATLLRVK